MALHSVLRFYLAWKITSNARRRRKRFRRLRQRALLRDMHSLLDIPEEEFRVKYRLTKEAFSVLCEELRSNTSLRSSQRISLELKVLCALTFFATGSYQRIVGETKYITQRTASSLIKQVRQALNEPGMCNKYIHFPDSIEERNIIKNRFFTKYGIPGVVGCVDGCHFHIFSPPKDVEHLYFCRKHFHSLNVQMVCDSEHRILSITAKYGGACHDAYVWKNSATNTYMQSLHTSNEFVWLLGDSGYPLRPWLMTPVENPLPESPESMYNKIHMRARVVIENTFALLKNRWRCLCKDRILHYAPIICAETILACSVLHNFSLNWHIPESYLDGNTPHEFQRNEVYFNNSEDDRRDLQMGRLRRAELIRRLR